jgi:hypothetical protein
MANFKVRDEYFRVAQRHLAVCKELQERIEVFEKKEKSNSSLSESEILLKHQLLCDLYYLAGYVIECTYCMVIFHHFPNIDEKKLLVAQANSVGINNISFKKLTNKNDTQQETFVIVDSNHRLNLFKKVFTPDYLNIENPIRENLFERPECKNLFHQYEAEVRYAKTELPILKKHIKVEKIFKLLEAAEINFKNCNAYHPR